MATGELTRNEAHSETTESAIGSIFPALLLGMEKDFNPTTILASGDDLPTGRAIARWALPNGSKKERSQFAGWFSFAFGTAGVGGAAAMLVFMAWSLANS
jgi:hypothetical protein